MREVEVEPGTKRDLEAAGDEGAAAGVGSGGGMNGLDSVGSGVPSPVLAPAWVNSAEPAEPDDQPMEKAALLRKKRADALAAVCAAHYGLNHISVYKAHRSIPRDLATQLDRYYKERNPYILRLLDAMRWDPRVLLSAVREKFNVERLLTYWDTAGACRGLFKGFGLEEYVSHTRFVNLYAELNRTSIAYAVLNGLEGLRRARVAAAPALGPAENPPAESAPGAAEQAAGEATAAPPPILSFQDVMARRVCNTIHNYVDVDAGIIRKGAIRCLETDMVVIPLNMRDGILFCRGKANPEWNYSGPHGAGRILSRTQAFRQLDVQQFQDDMKGIYSSCVGRDLLDEAPRVYKPKDAILRDVGPAVEVVDVWKPLWNYKGVEKQGARGKWGKPGKGAKGANAERGTKGGASTAAGAAGAEQPLTDGCT